MAPSDDANGWRDSGLDNGIDALARCTDTLLADGDVELLAQAQQSIDAARLIRLGARAPLAQRLTGLAKKTVNRLYRQLTGRPSPQGQTYFTDHWYVEDVHRMLQAAVVWNLYQRHANDGSRARAVIDIYEAYQSLFDEPLLNLSRAVFVLEMVAAGEWRERSCGDCQTGYLAPLDSRDTLCPGCRLYYRYRCRCGAAMTVNVTGRRRKTCGACAATHA